MKIIFLDIDGVLNRTGTPNPRKLPYIVDKTLLRRFKALLDRTGAKVVLSSTWRYDPAGLFSARHWGIPFIGYTPDLPNKPRRDEILAWLREHRRITRLAVLDDDDDELDDLPLFQPASSEGLTRRIANGMARYLEGTTEQDMRRGRIVRLVENVHDVLTWHKG
jgi:hypothetical protein